MNLKVEALGGFSAGVVGTIIGYPLDLVKTRMQTTAQGDGFVRVGSRIVRQGELSSMLGFNALSLY